jgi:glycosyltransferase A (GT-A) superfamily protein (DUF2064 family)
MSMRRDAATAVVLFTGDVRREERRKHLPRRLLSTVHADIAREVRRAGPCDLFVCGSATEVTTVAGIFAAGSRPVAEQISTALASLFAGGYESVIVIAGDVAALQARHIARASRQLRGGERRAVIGPCRDGGFYLAGFNRCPDIDWDALPWFGATIAAALSVALANDGFAVEQIQTLDDIDSLGDARRIGVDLLHVTQVVMHERVAPVRRVAFAHAMHRRPPPPAA